MTRRDSRERAIELLFERSFDYERTPEEIMADAKEEREAKLSEFTKELFLRADENMGDIDEKIARCADNWRIDRIGRVTLTILRLAACEIDYFPEIPIEITVNEALELAKKFDDEKSVSFINGVLGKYASGKEKPLAKQKPLSAEADENEPDEADEAGVAGETDEGSEE